MHFLAIVAALVISSITAAADSLVAFCARSRLPRELSARRSLDGVAHFHP